MQQPPEKIDKYQILSVLGKGAMGVVYHAYDPVVKRDVAIKLLSAIGSEETELISRFEREARLAGSLRHPNIVTIYDLGHHEGRPYIAMEYIVGRDLQTIIKQKIEITFEQKVEIILQIAKGLDAAHQKGIIHRDIKPANVRIQEDNTVKIMDFGIARMGTSELTRSGYIIGTLQYMSPEQISGDQLDPRTDIFSAGVIGYELFTFSNPFSGEHTVDIMYRILNVRPQPLQDIPAEHGTELNQIIMRALEKNRELRYASAKEMSQDLEEYLFYIKSLKFRKKVTTKVAYQEGATQTLPIDQLPVPGREGDIPPTMAADITSMPTYHMPAPPVPPSTSSQSAPPRTSTHAATQITSNTSPPVPTFGAPEPFRKEVPVITDVNATTGTAQVTMAKPTVWQEKKFYILGGIVALLFISGLVFLSSRGAATTPVALVSTPEGAEVFWNGQKIGETPTTINQKKQDMSLTFRKEGFEEKQVDVQEGNWPAEISVKLDAKPAPGPPIPPGERRIKLVTVPAGAAVTLNGQNAGVTPTEVTVAAGKSPEMELQLQGYQPIKQTLSDSTPESLTLELTALPAEGFIQYKGEYSVTMFVGGKPLKGNPVSLQPGQYKVTFSSSKKAYIRFSKTVDVVPGETVVVHGPGMGTLSINATPSNCKIYINSEFIDVPPIFNFPVQEGTHTIRFQWEKLGKQQTKTVTVSADTSERITGVPE